MWTNWSLMHLSISKSVDVLKMRLCSTIISNNVRLISVILPPASETLILSIQCLYSFPMLLCYCVMRLAYGIASQIRKVLLWCENTLSVLHVPSQRHFVLFPHEPGQDFACEARPARIGMRVHAHNRFRDFPGSASIDDDASALRTVPLSELCVDNSFFAFFCN